MNKYIITDEVLISFDNIISLKFIKRNMRFSVFDKNEHEEPAFLKVFINSTENFTISANSYEDDSNIKEIYNNYKEYLLNKEGIKI